MAIPSRILGDFEFAGNCVFSQRAVLPGGTVTDASVASGANIAASKLAQRHHVVIADDAAANAANSARVVFIAHRNCTLEAVYAAIESAPTNNCAVSIDVLKSTGGANFSTLLANPITIDSNTNTREALAANIATNATLAAGDLLRYAVTVSGEDGDQAKGVSIDAVIIENGT